MYPYPDRRVGRFIITNELIQEYPISVRLMFGTMIPFEVSPNVVHDTIEGLAWCPDFEEVKQGALFRTYTAEMREGRIAWH